MSGFSEITSAMYHDAQATIATQAAQIEALTKALNAARPIVAGRALSLGHPDNIRDANEVLKKIDAALSNTGKK